MPFPCTASAWLLALERRIAAQLTAIALWLAGWIATWSLAVAAIAPSSDVASARLIRSRWAAHVVNALGFGVPISRPSHAIELC